MCGILVHMSRTVLLTLLVASLYTSTTRSADGIKEHFSNILPGDSITATDHSIQQMMNEILLVAGKLNDFELQAANVRNLEAVISHHKKIIRFNPKYMQWISKVSGDKWSSYALIAHEIGHHVKGHTKKRSGSKPRVELEADEFAGFILARLGASLEQAQEVMNYIAGETASKSHPGRVARKQAIKKGWENAFISSGSD